jgi:hypothetical protein
MSMMPARSGGRDSRRRERTLKRRRKYQWAVAVVIGVCAWYETYRFSVANKGSSGWLGFLFVCILGGAIGVSIQEAWQALEKAKKRKRWKVALIHILKPPHWGVILSLAVLAILIGVTRQWK